MPFDTDKLTPAPWNLFGRAPDGVYCISGEQKDGTYPRIVSVGSRGSGKESDEANAAFIALARNAFDVMMRRFWAPDNWGEEDGWRLSFDSLLTVDGLMQWNNEHGWPDPFTALVEADKWCKEIEAKGKEL